MINYFYLQAAKKQSASHFSSIAYIALYTLSLPDLHCSNINIQFIKNDWSCSRIKLICDWLIMGAENPGNFA